MRDPKPWDYGLATDDEWQRMQTDRSWAPPDGTSKDEYSRVASELEAAVRATLAASLPDVPALSVSEGHLGFRYPTTSGWYTLRESQGPGVYQVSIALEYRPGWPIDDQRTHMTIWHNPNAADLAKCPLIDAWMHGLVARDPRQLVDMTLATIQQHRCT